MQREALSKLTLAAEERKRAEDEATRERAYDLVDQFVREVEALVDLDAWTERITEALEKHASDGLWKADIFKSLPELDEAIWECRKKLGRMSLRTERSNAAYVRLNKCTEQFYQQHADHWNAHSNVLATVKAITSAEAFLFAFDWRPLESAHKKSKTAVN